MAHKLEEQIHGLLDTLLADYCGGRIIDAEVTLDHPNKDIVIDIYLHYILHLNKNYHIVQYIQQLLISD